MNRSPFSSLTRALTVLSCLFALTACSEEPLLADSDSGQPMADAAIEDGGERDGGTADGGSADAGAPDAGSDAGPPCEAVEPGAPTDPASGEFSDELNNPGVGGTNPGVGAFAFGSAGQVYVGGNFTAAGQQSASNVAMWSGTTGWSPLGAGLPTSVGALAVGADGSVYAAHADDGTGSEMRISRWDGTAWTTFADADGSISELQAVGANLFVAGDFATIGGAAHSRLAYHDGTAWQGFADAPDRGITALSAVSTSDVCIGGSFTTVGSVAAAAVACWDGAAWQPRDLPTDLTYPRVGVGELARDPADGSLVVAGNIVLDDTGATNDGHIARWVGGAWVPIGGGSSGPIGNIAFAGGELFVGGDVFTVGSHEVSGAARWDGTAWHDMGGVYRGGGFLRGGPVAEVAAGPDGSVYFGGQLVRADTVGASRVVRWDGTYWATMRTPGERYHGVAGAVHALETRGSCATYVGGEFVYAGGVRVNGIASYTRESGYAALGAGVAGVVRDIHVASDGLVYVTGNFTDGATGTAFRNAAVWDGTEWRGFGAGVGHPTADDQMPNAIAVAEASTEGEPDLVYVGGQFTSAGGERATNLAMWDGTAWSDLGIGMLGHPFPTNPSERGQANISALLVDPATGDLIVGGRFSAIGRDETYLETNNIARWDGTTWHAYDRGLGDLEGVVLAMTWWNGRLAVARSFTGDDDLLRFAVWNGTEWEGIGTNQPGGTPVSIDGAGDSLFVAGNFNGARHITAFDGTTWSTLGEGSSDVALAISATVGGVLVGGVFNSVGETSSAGIAFWQYAE